jgi:hypothetical protein
VSLVARITALAQAVGADIKAISANVMDLAGTRRMTGAFKEAPAVFIDSGTGSMLNLATADANTVYANGTGTVGSLGSGNQGQTKRVYFQQAMTLRHSISLIDLPGQADIVTGVGDWAEFYCAGNDSWICIDYQRRNGRALAAADAPVTSVAGRTGAVVLAKADVGLGSVDNTSDSAKPVSTAQQAALDGKVGKTGDESITGVKTFSGMTVAPGGIKTAPLDETTIVSPNGSAGNPKVRVSGTAGTLDCAIALQSFGFNSVSFAPAIIGTRSSGSVGVHGAMSQGRTALAMIGAGSDGSAYQQMARLDAYSEAIPSSASSPGQWRFSTTRPGSTTPAVSLTVRGDGGIDVVGAGNFADSLAVTGPVKVGQYTLTTLPSASAYSGYEIDVTNAGGGSKRCRSNGTVWQILNTTTTVA